MKNIERILYLVVLVAVLVALAFTCKHNSNDNLIFQHNLVQVLNKQSEFLILNAKNTKQQLALLFPKLDSIAKANNISTSNLTNVSHTYINNHLGDTIITPLDSNWITGIDTNCMYATIEVDPYSKYVKWMTVGYENEITTFNYKERGRLFNIRWLPKWGKLGFFQKTVSMCDSVKVNQIFFEE